MICKTTCLIFAIRAPWIIKLELKKRKAKVFLFMILLFSRGILSKQDHLSCRCCQAVQLHWVNGLFLQKWDTFMNTSSLLSSSFSRPISYISATDKPGRKLLQTQVFSHFCKLEHFPGGHRGTLVTEGKAVSSFPVTTSWEITSSSLTWVHEIKIKTAAPSPDTIW